MDIKLNYVEKGEGKPLVLLHGNGGSLDCFKHQIEYFSRSYRVIAIDTRGHGKSPMGTKPFTIKQFAEDLKDFLDEHNLKNIYLLGYSDGGNIAITFALKYPEYIDKLILNGSNIFPSGLKSSCQIPIEINYRLTGLFAKKSEKILKKHLLLGLMVNEPNIKFEELKTLKMPTLVLVGTADMIKHSHSVAIANALPNSKFVALAGGHGIVHDTPKQYNKAVEQFLK